MSQLFTANQDEHTNIEIRNYQYKGVSLTLVRRGTVFLVDYFTILYDNGFRMIEKDLKKTFYIENKRRGLK